MAIPVFRALTSGGDSSGTSLTVNRPTGTADNDILIVVIYAETTSTISATGWTADTSAGGTNANGAATDFVLRVFWKRASSEPASWSFTWGGANIWRGYCCAAYSGGITTGTPVEGATYNESETGTSTITGTSVTTTGANRKLIFGGCFYYLSATTFGSPSSGTRRGSVGALVFLCDDDAASSGSTGNRTIQPSAVETSTWSAGMTAIIEASAAAATSLPIFPEPRLPMSILAR